MWIYINILDKFDGCQTTVTVLGAISKIQDQKKCFEIDWFHSAEKPTDFLNISNVQIPLHSIRYIPGTWNIHFKGSITMIPNLYNGKMVDLSPNIHPSISKNWPRPWRNSRWLCTSHTGCTSPTWMISLAKLLYFTNLDFPEIRGFPLLNHHLGWGRVRSLWFDQISGL